MQKEHCQGVCLDKNGEPAAIYKELGCDSLIAEGDRLHCKQGQDLFLVSELGVCDKASVNKIPGTVSKTGFEPRVDTAG